MNNRFFKLACLAIAATSAQINGATSYSSNNTDSCSCFNRGEPLSEQLGCPAAYNLPASVLIENDSWMNSWYLDLSALYWRADQEGMHLARTAALRAGPTTELIEGSFFEPNFEFQPGFKVGIGARAEDWVLYTEYTWIRNTVSRSGSAPAVASDVGTGLWNTFPWFLQESDNLNNLAATQIGSKWKLGIDLLDGGFSRPYYVGKNLTLSPFAGIRAAWFRQSVVITMTESSSNFTAISPQPLVSTNRSHNWGIGPRMGTEARCLFPMGFRSQGDIAVSLLYTKFTRVTHKETSGTTGYPSVFTANEYNVNTLRPALEMGLGLGWGMYSYCGRYHIDFSADYDFLFFPNQNRMRTNLDEFQKGTAASYDLHIQGVTVTAKLDF